MSLPLYYGTHTYISYIHREIHIYTFIHAAFLEQAQSFISSIHVLTLVDIASNQLDFFFFTIQF